MAHSRRAVRKISDSQNTRLAWAVVESLEQRRLLSGVSFSAAVSYPVGGAPYRVKTADFNGDGKPDVLQQGTGTLVVLLGKGDGTFGTPNTTASGASLISLLVADLNGDGKWDVVGASGSSLFVYISKGDGTFSSAVTYNLGVTPPGEILLNVGDFNGDGKTDVAASLAGFGPSPQLFRFRGCFFWQW